MSKRPNVKVQVSTRVTGHLEKAMFPPCYCHDNINKHWYWYIDNWKRLLLSAKHCAGNISLTPHNHPTGRSSYFSHFPDEEFCSKPPEPRWLWAGEAGWSLGEEVVGAGAEMVAVGGYYVSRLRASTAGQPLRLCFPKDKTEAVTPTLWCCYKDGIKGGKQSLWHLGHTP